MPSLNTQITPEPTIYEQYPAHWGAALTVAAITSRLRSAEIGSRQEYVDMLSELIEGDPHAAGVINKLVTGISNKPFSLEPADLGNDATDAEKETAAKVAGEVERIIRAIPSWKTHVAGMLWGHIYGVTAREIMWVRDATEWRVASLEHVHSRRIDYGTNFRPYISQPGSRSVGIVFDDFPGKFLVFEPRLSDEYQTRQGCGRYLSYWLGFKRFSSREFVGYVERFGKPFPFATYSTSDDGKPAPADDSTIADAKNLVRKIGRGSEPGGVFPDSISLQLLGVGGESARAGSGEGTPHKALIDLVDAQVSKLVLGGTLTTDVGSTGGNRALGERQGDDQEDIQCSLAGQFDDMVTAALVRWIVLLNYGEGGMRYCPRYHTHVEPEENELVIAQTLKAYVDAGLKVPAAWAHERTHVPIPDGDEEVLGAADPADEQPQDGGNDGPAQTAPDSEDDSSEE